MTWATIPYVAKYGDYLVKVAQEHGTTWQAIWNHPLNAEHRHKRGSPDVLYPGDELHIPSPPAEPPGSPPEPPASRPPPSAPPALPPSWPFQDVPESPPPWPEWHCPAGTCVCHRGDDSIETLRHGVRLFDHERRPMPSPRARVSLNGRLLPASPYQASSAGEIEFEIPAGTRRVWIEWAPAEARADSDQPYRKHYYLVSEPTASPATRLRIHNLGFLSDKGLQRSVVRFRGHYGSPLRRPIEDDWDLRSAHDDGHLPPNGAPLLVAGKSTAQAVTSNETTGGSGAALDKGTVVPKSCSHPRSLKSHQAEFDTNAGSTLNATVRAEVHDAINDIVAATGGNYELGVGFYERAQQSEAAVLDLVYFELKSLSVAAQYESFLYQNDRIWLSDSLFNGHYPEARASVVVHEASHVKHKAASLTNEWLEGESYALDLFLAEELARHFGALRRDMENERCATIRSFDAHRNFHGRKGNLALAVSSHYVHYGAYRVFHELRQGRTTHFDAAIHPRRVENMKHACSFADQLTANLAYDKRPARMRSTRAVIRYMILLYEEWISRGTKLDPVLLPRGAASAHGGTWLQVEPNPSRLLPVGSGDWARI